MRRLDQRYMGEEMNQTLPPPWLVNNILFCYDGDTHQKWNRWQHFIQHSGSKEAYTDWSKSTGRKVSYAAVFTLHQNRGTSEEASIHKAEMIAMKDGT